MATPEVKTFNQNSFIGGLNRLFDPTKLEATEYPYLKNGRNRREWIEPIKQPLLLNNLPSGKLQGIYAAANYLIVFVDGKAYYKDCDISYSTFIQIQGYNLSATVDEIYMEAVPASTMLYKRKLKITDQVNGDVDLFGEASASYNCVVAQDGVTQPMIIFQNGICEPAQTFEQWTVDEREYIPIGKQMLYTNGILYIVHTDGNQILRSVTGRPLDFVVAVDTSGNKVLTTDDDGNYLGAQLTSTRVSTSEITAIKASNNQDGSFLVSTIRASYLVTPNYASTIYNEPTFKITFLFNTGALNNNCVVDLLGDTTLIDFNGIRSFNAVFQTKYEGKNAPFSAKVQGLFESVIQSKPCGVEFDNYGMFAVKTVYGDCIVVYDTIAQKYVGIDLYTNVVGTIVQFASIKTPTQRKLYFSTTANKIYEMFAGADFEECEFFAGEYSSNNPSEELQPRRLRLVFIDTKESGTIYATTYIDRLTGKTFSAPLKGSVVNESLPITAPFGIATDDTAKIKSFDLGRERQGWKIGILISWHCNAKLSHVNLEADVIRSSNSLEETAGEFSAYSKGLVTIDSFSPDAAEQLQSVTVTGSNFTNVLAVRIGSKFASGFNIINQNTLQFTVPVGATADKIVLVMDSYEVESQTEVSII